MAQDAASFKAAQEYFANKNPYRDLPSDQESSLKEVLFIVSTFGFILLPTSLPDEDDYTFLSLLLRSLETRRDISWTIFEETSLHRTVMAIGCRGQSGHEPVATEPYELPARFKALYKHWEELLASERRPRRWEAEHDTTFLPPLLENDVSESADKDSVISELLSNEQRKEMENIYAEWRKERDRRVSYLKLHPPQPMGWVRVSDAGTARNDVVGEDGVGQAGIQNPPHLWDESPRWRPLYRSLTLEDVPVAWSVPGENRETQTAEGLREWFEEYQKEQTRRDERMNKQMKLQERLKKL